MVNINILSYIDHNLFDHLLDNNRFSKDYRFYENSSLDIEWDMVIVFEAIVTPKTIQCKKGGLIFISGEPPMASVYSSRFLKQFDFIFTAHPKIKNFEKIIRKQYFNDWHFGFDYTNKMHKYTFLELQQMKAPVKTKNISIITSSLAVLPFHLKRLNFLTEIKETFGDKIDYYGRGYNFVNDKAEAILPYRFHICIENTSIKDLWTEKFADPLLGFSVPIYIGCSNMDNYFPKDSFYFLNIDDIGGAIHTINQILSDPVKCYNEKIGKLIQARQLLINEYNIYPTIVNLYLSIKLNLGNVETTIIKSNFDSLEYTIRNYTLRLKRFIYKKYFILKEVLR